ncbi:hypothetical protein HELRODRAFT_162763 [Helobdella robusta]|uniref:Claudin n=1 Tax=Helobdella robusta TaxID=6412 RepID=T1ET37_HELRO|nr:hypothetical protein HELRODRAFT_162763 [Helobdella robusta]ESN99245.1 hypothetical protein HELRODRAFT_162763 [Helobdella robusta]
MSTRGPVGCVWIVVTVVVILAALVCNLIAISTNFWLKSSTSSKSDFLNVGLWVACFHDYVHTHETPSRTYNGCHAINSDYFKDLQHWLLPPWLVVCQFMALIGLILLIIGSIFALFLLAWILCKCICGQETSNECCQRCLVYTTPIIMFVASLFMVMAATAFADNAFKLQCKDYWLGGDPNNNRLSYSWGFEIASIILTIISGGLLTYIGVKTAHNYKPYTLTNS